MGMIASIQQHSRRSYLISQSALASALCASALLALGVSHVPMAAGTALFAATATGTAMFVIHHARQGLYRRLAHVRQLEQERQQLLETDVSTGALTRRYFLESLDAALRPGKTDLTLAVIDIDHFKQLNDSLGHPAGDAALAHLVRCLKQTFSGTIGRLGGDEFALYQSGEDRDALDRRIAAFYALVREPFFHDGRQVAISVSIGLAHAADGEEVASLIQHADIALYASKLAGRGRATHFHAEMMTDRRHVRFIERELRAGIFLNHLELHYQPIVDASGETHGYEGLVRWRHPSRGLVPPGEFIEVAERSTLIDTLGEWVLRRACLDLEKFGGRRISINISGEQLKRDALVATARRVLAQTGADANLIMLEITESVATSATADVLRRLSELRALGFRVALDDFGTGHCGFSSLQTLPIDCVKIDRLFVQNLRNDRLAQILVSALAQVGQLKDILIVAEGIETSEDMALARAAGCNRFQGFLIGRPAHYGAEQTSRAVGASEQRRIA